MKFNKPDEHFPKILHEGYLAPTHYLTINLHNVSEMQINMRNTTSNLFIGKRKHIEKIIKNIIHCKSESKDFYEKGEFFLITLWDNNEKKESSDIIMLATFESTETYTIKLPLSYYFQPYENVLILTNDENIDSCPLMALDNLQKEYLNKKNTILDEIKVKTLLKNNVTQEVLENFRIFELEDQNFYSRK